MEFNEKQLVKSSCIAAICCLTSRRVEQLTADGIFRTIKPEGSRARMYELGPTVRAYCEYLQKRSTPRDDNGVEATLKKQKLEAEIALKESQAELHRLKTDIAAGKYISVEEVQLDLQKFFVVFKKFATAIPNRVSGMINGYADPVTVRAIEKDLSKEISSMLRSFVNAAQPDDK